VKCLLTGFSFSLSPDKATPRRALLAWGGEISQRQRRSKHVLERYTENGRLVRVEAGTVILSARENGAGRSGAGKEPFSRRRQDVLVYVTRHNTRHGVTGEGKRRLAVRPLALLGRRYETIRVGESRHAAIDVKPRLRTRNTPYALLARCAGRLESPE